MAVFHCVEQLEENVFDETIVPQIAAAMQDLCGEIMVRRIVHDNVHVCILLNHAVEGDDARVGRGDLMESDFANLDLPLAESPMPGGNKAFHCAGPLGCMVAGVNRTINDTEASNTQNFDEFEGSSINECSDGRMGGERTLRIHGVPQGCFFSMGIFPVGCFSILCKVAKQIMLIGFGLSLNLATPTYKAFNLILGYTYAGAMMPL